MKIRIPKTIQTSNGEVELLPYNSGGSYNRGLIDGWKAGFISGITYASIYNEDIEFIEGEE